MASKHLSAPLKALLKAPHAHGGPLPAPCQAAALFNRISSSAHSNGLDHHTWLALSTAALVTLNSPASLVALYDFSTKDLDSANAISGGVERAALMREAGLKCISLSGIPRVINSLGALRSHLPESVASQLNTAGTRLPTPSNIADITGPRAWSLWDSIYTPFSSKLISKLALSHPDLPITILSSHYGALLSDPPLPPIPGHVKVGRVLTSVVAMACLRAQQGVGLQVTSHVFGLKKSLGEGRDEQRIAGEEWLVTDEGCEWVLRSVDDIVAEVRGGKGSFAVGRESKL